LADTFLFHCVRHTIMAAFFFNPFWFRYQLRKSNLLGCWTPKLLLQNLVM